MVTGDHPLTAEAVARRLNIISGPARYTARARIHKTQQPSGDGPDCTACIVVGEDIPELSEADWRDLLTTKEVVFARTSPKHKLEIVTRAQALGHIVGVTGDGVNDAGALKKAHLGIAMNKTGSDVSKEAAGMILLDDNFMSIVHGILEGKFGYW
jgi:sodium/potassium-transporting ATPase subunit alpha